MAPSHSRQLLVWTLPTIAALLSYLWYKKKRIGVQSDTGGTKDRQEVEEVQSNKSLEEELREVEISSPVHSTPKRNFSRSLSGVDSSPIDIVFPPEYRSAKPNSIVISDEDLDIEIEKIKSMKNGALSISRPENSPPQVAKVKTPSPVEESTKDKSIKNSKIKENSRKETPQIAQKNMAVVEEKLSSLKIKETIKKREHKNSIGNRKDREDLLQRQSSERDSANHSPSDVMLASPSLSSISDNHSEVG